MSNERTIPTIQYGAFSRRVHEQAAAHRHVIKAQLELTYRCNLHCRHCYTDPYNSKDFFPRELTLDEIHRLLDEMQQLGIVWLNLTGGDIFMHPQFFEIYETAYRKGFLLQLYTNGTLFTNATIERLQQMPPFTIDISCHSVTEEPFDWFTQVPGSFRSFVRGLKMLKDSGLPLALKTKAMNWNRDEMPVIKQFVESFGQEFGFTTSLSPRLNGDLSSLAYRVAPEDDVALRGDGPTQDPDEELCGESTTLHPPITDRLYRCGCATDTIHINAWGELGTCTLQYERRVSLRTHPLADAIELLFREVRGMRYEGKSPCRTCTVHTFCDKKPSDARWECGTAEAPIPYDCDVAIARAQSALHQTLIHPLRRVHKEVESHHD
ncbi:MAG: radical SAM protein [Nitrospirota bacterium]|nr:radical SAM protein [Nitrospirota bacterium]